MKRINIEGVTWEQKDKNVWEATSHERFDGFPPKMTIGRKYFSIDLHSEDSGVKISKNDIPAYWNKLNFKDRREDGEEDLIFAIATHYVKEYTIY